MPKTPKVTPKQIAMRPSGLKLKLRCTRPTPIKLKINMPKPVVETPVRLKINMPKPKSTTPSGLKLKLRCIQAALKEWDLKEAALKEQNTSTGTSCQTPFDNV
jgi:hypothetical protein